MVKKMIAVIAIIIGALMVISGVAPMVIGAIIEAQMSTSVGIIGGTDGPTAVMVTGVTSAGHVLVEILAGFFLIVAGIFGCRRLKK